MEETAKRPSKAIVALVVIVLLALVAGAVIYVNRQNAADSAGAQTEQRSSEAVSDTPASGQTRDGGEATQASQYADGNYSATGGYSTPGGRQSVEVSITLENDVITAVTANGTATGGESQEYQERFESGYEELVVGKNIDEVNLSRVAGSSLTSNGFNAALEQIKSEAA